MSGALIEGASHLLDLDNVLLLGLGTALGIVFGAVPGLTATMGLALLVPFTFSMDPASGLLMLAGIYVGAMYGDAIPAILINTPGTPAAIATTFDGFPLARKGMAQHALVTAAFASFVGSVLANLVLATSAEPLAEMSLNFGPPEYFWLGIFGLTIISVLSSGNLLKGFIAAAIGLLFSSVGMATLSGDVRLTFGYPELQGGIGLAGALIGFFCLPEILSNVIGRRREHYAGAAVRPSVSVIVETISDLVRRPVLMARSSLIGLVVGVAPGAGGNIASMVSYSEATRWERDGDEFGKGTIRGVAASEAANSAMAPGSLIPLLTLGIPGSPPAAVILGALMLHGMQPGVELFAAHSSVVYAFIAGLAVAAFAVLLLGTLGSFVYARIVNIPSRALAPAILVLAGLGAYAIRNNMLDVWVMLMFGVIGFVLTRLNYHPAPLVLGFILGPYIENGIVQSTMLGGASGNVLAYMTLRPISIVLIVLCMLSASWPLLSALARRRRQLREAARARAPDAGAGTDLAMRARAPDAGAGADLAMRARAPDAGADPDLAVRARAPDAGVNTDLAIGFATVAVAAVAFMSTRELSRFGGLFVEHCVAALAILGLATILKGIVRPERRPFFESPAERRRVTVGVGLLAAYLFLLPYLGFLIASIGFYFAMQRSLGSETGGVRPLALGALTAIGVSGALYVLFRHVLLVPLPVGAWGI